MTKPEIRLLKEQSNIKVQQAAETDSSLRSE